ncbi:MAG: hypothetical protein ACTHJW_08900, partial [Streptosporangiaceae bacterium]
MTQTISASAPGRSPETSPQPGQQPNQELTAHGIGTGLILLGVFLLGFLAYLFGISGVQEARAQSNAYATLRGELGQQVAPLAAAMPGAPVAILNIPAIGITNMIVVEGTSPENLELGPGHVPN